MSQVAVGSFLKMFVFSLERQDKERRTLTESWGGLQALSLCRPNFRGEIAHWLVGKTNGGVGDCPDLATWKVTSLSM